MTPMAPDHPDSVSHEKKAPLTPWITWGGLILAGMIIFIGGSLLIFQTNWAQQKVQDKINAALPGSIIWEQGRISVIKGFLELRKGRLLDPEQQTTVTFDRLGARLNLFALLRKTVDITALTLETPHVNLSNNPDGLNIKRVFSTPGADTTVQNNRAARPFKWIIRSLHINNGRLDYNDPAKQITVNATSIELTGGGNFAEHKATGGVTIGAMEIQSPRYRQRFTSLILSTQLTEDQLIPLSVNLTTNRSQLSLKGSITHLFTEPHLDLRVDAELDLAEIETLLPLEAGLKGRIVARMQAQGSWTDPNIALTLTSTGATFFSQDTEDFLIDLTIANRMATLKETRFSLSGGTTRLTGAIDLSPLFPQNLLHYEDDLANVAYDLTLEGNALQLASLFPPDAAITGITDGRLKISGRGFDPRNGTAEVSVGINARRVKTRWIDHPHDIKITLTGHLADGTAAWSGFHLRTKGFDLTSKGQFHLVNRRIDGDLSLNLPELARAPAPLGLKAYHGRLALDAVLSGFSHAPEIELKLTGQDLRRESLRLGNLFLAGHYTDRLITVRELRLVNSTSAVSVDGSISLKDPQTGTWISDPAIDLTIKMAAIELRDFFTTIEGRLNLKGAMAGTVQNPAGQLMIEGRDIELEGQVIEAVNGAAHLHNGRVTVDTFKISLPRSAPITLTGDCQFDGAYNVDIAANGVDLSAIAFIKDQSLVQGRLDLQLSGRGNVADPQFNGNIQLRRLYINGNPSKEVNLALTVADGTARINGDLGFTIAGVYAFKPAEFNLSAHFKDTDLATYFALFNRPRLGGRLTGHISAHGNAARMAEMTAQVGLTDMRLTYDGQNIVSSGQANLILAGGKATLSSTAVELLNNGYLQAEGEINMAENLNLSIQGALPAKALQILRPEALGLSGNIDVEAWITGASNRPVYQADITLTDIGGTIPHLNQKLRHINGNIRIDTAKLVVDDLRGSLEDGSFRLSGTVDWNQFKPRAIDLELTAQKLPVSIPEILQARIDGNLKFYGRPRKSRLSGRLMVHDGLYYQDVNLKEVMAAQASSASPKKAAQKQPGILGWENIALDIVLKRGGLFRVENNLSEMDIDFDLYFHGYLDRPTVNGRAQVLSGEIYFPVLSVGTLAQTSWIPASTQTFMVQRGVIDFINPSRIEPHLDIRGQVNIRHWIVYLDISGTPDALEFELSSNPSESEADIVSLLLTGRTAGEMSGEGESTSLSNEQRLLEFMASTFQDDIKAITGLDIIETESSSGDAQSGEASVTVTVGKNLSERVTLKYATESRGADIINSVIAEYRILENIRAQGFQNTAGNFGGSFTFRHEFR